MDRVMDLGRAIVAALALLSAGFVSAGPAFIPQELRAQTLVQDTNNNKEQVSTVPESLAEWAIRQGGAFAVLVIVLWFYRRDYKDLSEYWKQHAEGLTTLIQNHTKAETELSKAIENNSSALDRLRVTMGIPRTDPTKL